MANKIEIALVIRGDEIDQGQISNHLGTNPTTFTVKGSRRTTPTQRPDKSSWRLYADKDISINNIDELWANLKNKTNGRIYHIRDGIKLEEIDIEIVIYFDSKSDNLCIPGEMIDFAKNYCCDIKFYYYDR